ncbi:DgyrCDS2549 [Dimorphilus gyrociliatus]|uniref:DgyrCDS2549 n=1 Tax=Dimorphilus gyrociliatus TaxID=2664684 RepID=A0A7I8VCL0_9ANNE|nr:DgyrCDS2549 [Dimorphilus gyrociliatus]
MLLSLAILISVLSPSLTSKGKYSENDSASDCVKTFKSEEGKEGTFTSPRYPEEYSSGQQCKYEFIGNPEERVQVIFEEVQLYYISNDAKDPTECTSIDSIRVQIKDEGDLKDIGLFCGEMDNRQLMSPNQFMEVIFDSVEREESSIKAPFKGFKARYKFLTNFGIYTGIQDKADKCIFTFTSRQAKSGMFTSPNYPGDYPRNTECQYVFKGEMEEEEIVQIHFLTFSVEGIKPCTEETKSDSVSFSNFGFRISDRKMSKLCGNFLSTHQRTVTSDGPYFRVIFKSNSVYDDKGFEASYQFKKKKGHSMRFYE